MATITRATSITATTCLSFYVLLSLPFPEWIVPTLWVDGPPYWLIMEALAAISLAGNMLQFVQFSTQIVATAVQYRRSLTGLLQSHENVESSLRHLDLLIVQLKDDDRALEKRRYSVVDAALRDQVDECVKIGQQMRKELDSVRIQGSRSILNSTRKAWRAIWTEEKIEKMEARLKAIQDRMNLQLSIDQRAQLRGLAANQAEILSKLDTVSLQIFRNVLDDKQALGVDSDAVSGKTLITQDDSRREISSKLNDVHIDIEAIHTKLDVLAGRPNGGIGEDVGDIDLYEAVRDGRLTRVQQLLQQDLDVNWTHHDEPQERALHVAARQISRNGKMLSLLLAYQPDVNAYSGHGLTPLMIAAAYGNTMGVSLLLDAGATMELPLKDHRPSVSEAIDLDNMSTSGSTALLLAAQNGHGPIVQHMLQRGAKCSVKSNHQFNPLIAASQRGHVECVSTLLSTDINIEDATDQGFTSLIYAASCSHVEIVQLLLDHGANIEAAKHGGMTVLLEAVWNDRTDMVSYLARRGANINARCNIFIDESDYTGLHVAVVFGYVEMVKALLEAGADAQLRDGKGRTPAILAAQRGRTEQKRLLDERNVPKNGVE